MTIHEYLEKELASLKEKEQQHHADSCLAIRSEDQRASSRELHNEYRARWHELQMVRLAIESGKIEL